MKKSLLTLLALLCVVVQGSWAQDVAPSTALEPYITTLGNRMVYKFNYPKSDVWYTIDGRRLTGKPTRKGLYIINGRKLVIK